MAHQLAPALALLVTAGCHGGPPDPPTAAAWQAMSGDQRCAATEPRAGRCGDALVMMNIDQLARDAHGGSQDTDLKALRDELAKDTHLNPSHLDEREGGVVHQENCVTDPGYAAAVYACWAVDGCDALTKCILARSPAPIR